MRSTICTHLHHVMLCFIFWCAVRQAQDSGESVRIMDDLMYALDGLSAKLPASTQQESALAIAETALTQRGRMALRCALQLQAVAARPISYQRAVHTLCAYFLT